MTPLQYSCHAAPLCIHHGGRALPKQTEVIGASGVLRSGH